MLILITLSSLWHFHEFWKTPLNQSQKNNCITNKTSMLQPASSNYNYDKLTIIVQLL